LSGIYLITLPIGNLDDITIRALNNLKELNVFYAEDTRVFKELLKNLGIDYSNKEIDSFHDHSQTKIEKIISRIKNGEKIGLVSDAGSPLVSDPAYPLLREIVKNDLKIFNSPGVTSTICALELSGLPANPFHFWGFIGRSENDKSKFYKELVNISGTHIFFESPHRIYETIRIFFQILPNSELVIARELTKTYEQIQRIKLDDLKNIEELVINKGEFVLLFHVDSGSSSAISEELKSDIQDFIDQGGNTKKLAKIFGKILNQDTREIYGKLGRAKQNS
jgi:16S rRNA (cytidine1402-2'-O)-methyltransferase